MGATIPRFRQHEKVAQKVEKVVSVHFSAYHALSSSCEKTRPKNEPTLLFLLLFLDKELIQRIAQIDFKPDVSYAGDPE